MNDAEIVKRFIERSETAIFETAEKYGALCTSTALVIGAREDISRSLLRRS